MLDFVPNHLGLDHAWVKERPELFVQSADEAPGNFRAANRRRICAGWPMAKTLTLRPGRDTVQLDYRRAATRTAMTQLLQSVARRCDGVRCDMAMLLLNEVFAKTWEQFPDRLDPPSPSTEFWAVGDSRGQGSAPRVPVPGGGVLGAGAATASARVRLHLRQDAL